MELDLGGIGEKIPMFLPYISYAVSLMTKLLYKFASFLGVDIGQNPVEDESESESVSETVE